MVLYIYIHHFPFVIVEKMYRTNTVVQRQLPETCLLYTSSVSRATATLSSTPALNIPSSATRRTLPSSSASPASTRLIPVSYTHLALVTIIGSLIGGAHIWGYYPGKIWSQLICYILLIPVEVHGREKIHKRTSLSLIHISNIRQHCHHPNLQ